MEDLNALMKASEKATKKQVQHIVLTASSDGTSVHACGSSNFMSAVVGNDELMATLSNVLLPSITKDGVLHANTRQPKYDLLPCSPDSSEWKGSSMIRRVLRSMLVKAEFGRAGNTRKLGVDAPPLGWPDDISWENYTGSTNSMLTVHASDHPHYCVHDEGCRTRSSQ